MEKRVMKNTMIYLVPNMISKGLGVFLLPLYVKVLSLADYGFLDLLTVFGLFAHYVVSCEINSSIPRFSDESVTPVEKNKVIATAWAWSIFSYGMFFVLMVVFTKPILSLFVEPEAWIHLFRVYCLVIVFQGLLSFCHNLLIWELRAKDLAWHNTVYAVSTVGFCSYLVLEYDLGINGVVWGQLLGSGLCLSGNVLRLRHLLFGEISFSKLREMLLFSLPFVPSNLSLYLHTSIDRFFINTYCGLEDVGRYAIAFRIASLFVLASSSFQSAVVPMIYKHHSDPETPVKIANLFRYYVIGAFCYLVLSCCWMPDVLTWLATKEFSEAIVLLPFLLSGLIVGSLNIFMLGIAIEKKTKFYFYINFIGVISGLLLNYILLSTQGVQGASIAKFINGCLVFSLFYIASQRLYFVPFRLGYTALFIATSTLLSYSIIHHQMMSSLTFFDQFFYMTLFIGSIFVFRMLGGNEIRELSRGCESGSSLFH